MPTLTKEALRNHMESKYKAKLGKLEEDFNTIVQETCNPVLDKMIQLKPLEIKATKLAEEINEAISGFNFTAINTGQSSVISNLNSYTSRIDSSLKNEIKRAITYSLKNPTQKKFIADNDAIYALQAELVEKTKPVLQSIADLKTLKKEIGIVIDKQPSAIKAVKILTELGVDVGEIAPEVMLPAIVKLSVDVSLIN